MKAFAYLAAMTLASISAPVSAQTFDVGIFGTVTGTQDRFNCGGPTQCEALFGSNTNLYSDFGLPFEIALARNLGNLLIPNGQSFTFTSGQYRSSGEVTGTITNNSGFLTGTNLRYSYSTCAPYGGSACSIYFAAAPTFSVTGGVPEPTVWAMMLMGFGAIGYSMRRKRILRRA